MVELKFEGLNRIENMDEILKSSDVDKERPNIYRTKCAVPRHRKIYNSKGEKISGNVDVEIVKGKSKNVYLTIRKDKLFFIGFEVEDGVIKLR